MTTLKLHFYLLQFQKAAITTLSDYRCQLMLLRIPHSQGKLILTKSTIKV